MRINVPRRETLNDVNAGSCLLVMRRGRQGGPGEAGRCLDVYSIYITLWALFHVLVFSNGNNMKACAAKTGIQEILAILF